MNSSRRRSHFARYFFLLLSSLTFFLGTTGVAFAGFGITPPYVQNERLTRGTVYEQRITLVRSDPTEDLTANITMNVPGIEDWISIDRGREFILPKGVVQVPIVITVHVPANADFKQYRGAIRIRTSSANSPAGGGVSIALGAQIDVNLKVVEKIYDFTVRKIRLVDLEEGRTKWGLFFPGKIRFFMTIENTGNTVFGPTKVLFEIYDSNGENLLETTQNSNDIEQISPFSIKEVLAELPTRLPAGRYVAKFTIFKNTDIAQQGQVDVSISAIGAVAGYYGYGFGGLSTQDKLKVIAFVGIPLVLLTILLIMYILRRRRRAAVKVVRK